MKAKFIGSIPMFYWGWEIYKDGKIVDTIKQCKFDSAKHGKYTNKDVLNIYSKRVVNG